MIGLWYSPDSCFPAPRSLAEDSAWEQDGVFKLNSLSCKICCFESRAFKRKRQYLPIVVILPILLSVCSLCVASSAEDEIKADFVLNFVRFVLWPDDYPQAGELNICYLGSEPLSGKLLLLDNRMAGRRRIKVSRSSDLSPNKCELVFFGRESEQKIEERLAELKGLPVLTISDVPEFVDRGGMIGLVVDNQNIGFEVNLLSASESRLRLSSQLLNLAWKVIK